MLMAIPLLMLLKSGLLSQMNKIPDITPHLVYPDDRQYVEAATKYWNALHKDWAKSVEEIQAKVFKEVFKKPSE